MRCAIVCISLRGGGTERIVCRLANHLAQRHEVTIVTLVGGDCFYALDHRVSVRSPSGRCGGGKVARVIRQLGHLLSVLRELNVEACLVFGEDIAAAGVICARVAGIGHVSAFFRGTPERSLRGKNGALNPFALRLARRIFVQTHEASRRLAGHYPAVKLEVWPNPLELADAVSPMSGRESLILSVGSIGRLKNQEALLRVFARLEQPHGWRLAFVGDGPNRPRLQQSAADLGIAGSVFFKGERQDVQSYFEQAAVFAFTSLSEGFPNALAEALAAGCACISYDCSAGPSELIQHGVNGYLVPMGDEDRFVELLQKLILDVGLRERFAASARASMRPFEADVVMNQLERVLFDGVGKATEPTCAS